MISRDHDVARIRGIVRGEDSTSSDIGKLHPQTNEHYIEAFFVVNNSGDILHFEELKFGGPNDEASIEFEVSSQSFQSLIPYSFW